MAVLDARTNLWEALLGRAPDRPLPADAELWQSVADRLNPARARPVLRPGVEQVHLRSARGGEYVMLCSPDERDRTYVRLAPEEADLVALMDGSRTVAQLVGDLARATGRLAPEQVQRMVADLAGGRMLEELPVDAFRSLDTMARRSYGRRLLRGFLAVAGGRRMVLADPDRAAGLAYRLGGRLLFTRLGVAAMVLVSAAGLAVWLQAWAGGARQAMVAGGSYGTGALLLLGLNVAGLAFHETGHALGVKHAGRRAPAVGVMLYFGIPSAYVDTTDVWMASRRHRLITTAAGPGFAITFAGAAQLVGLVHPGVAVVAFPLGFAWYLNSLLNLNPLMALDGYYLLMDWLEVPNLRPRAVALIVSVVRRPTVLGQRRVGDDALVARYAALALLWTVIFAAVMTRTYKDRFSGMWAGLGQNGWAARGLFAAVVAMVLAPVVVALARLGQRWARRARARLAGRNARSDLPRRLDALRSSRLDGLTPAQIAALAERARWVRPRRGAEIVAAGAPIEDVLVVVEGALEGCRPADPGGYARARAGPGDVVGSVNALSGVPSSLRWHAAGTALLAVPAAIFREVLGSLPGPVGAEGELDDLLESTPVFADLGPEERVALAASMRPVDAGPGKGFELRGQWAAIVGSGVVSTGDGTELGPGDLLGPPGPDAAVRAETRTSARLWTFPLATAPISPATSSGRQAPAAGMHGDDYGPLVLPWGSTPPPPDDEAEARRRRRFGWLVWLVLLLALLCLWVAARPGLAWAEIPDGSAIFEVRRGHAEAVVGGKVHHLGRGQRVVVRAGDEISIGARSLGRLELRGGAQLVLCPTTGATVDRVGATGIGPVAPHLTLSLHRGRALVDGTSRGSAFAPADLAVRSGGVVVRTVDGGRFATGDGRAAVGSDTVTVDGTPAPRGDDPLTCGTGGVVAAGTEPEPIASPTGADGPPGQGATTTTTTPSGSDEDGTGDPSGPTTTTAPTAAPPPGGGDPAPDGSQPPPTQVPGPGPTGPGPTGPGPTTTTPGSTTTTASTTTTTAATSTTTPESTTSTRPPPTTTTTTQPPRTTTTLGRG